MNQMKEDKKEIVFITGSSRGIGKAIAKHFGAEGFQVVIHGRDKKRLQATEQEMKEMGMEVMAVCGDVAVAGNCRDMVKEIEKNWGEVGIFVHNAGIAHIGLFTDMTQAEYEELIQVNLMSAFHFCHELIPAMVRKKRGNILFISSIWGNLGASCEAVYSASKGAIHAYSKSLAKELGLSGIRVNTIACGMIDTDMNACFSEEEKELFVEDLSLMRMGQAEEVADLAYYLTSEKASFLTGQVITLDGGG